MSVHAHDDSCVRVAVRIRPQLPKEKIELCRVCTSVCPTEPQVTLGVDKSFTYDHVFDLPTLQHTVYSTCVETLIEGCFEGYNATVLAYGQTGSGKTYTMGTGFEMNISKEEQGIVPRAVRHLFDGIEQRRTAALERNESPPEFKVSTQFLELYNEDIIDLFEPMAELDKNKKSSIRIHEDVSGGIYCDGVTTKSVSTELETLQALKTGALSRTTAATQMNSHSSRSHAIFTINIKQQRLAKSQLDMDVDTDTTEEALPEFETLTAKFHFVDLAGSERLKRTGATGDRAKEGISINCGLLALGNVISALGDKSKKATHVPYRDSKLTRLLQDSLGGNSRTLMIACISPTDRDFMETLNTLKYANRARNIKNKISVNQDKTSKQIAALRVELQALQLELMAYKTGKKTIDAEGEECVNDMVHENTMLKTENNNLRIRIKAMQETTETMTRRNADLLCERQCGDWINHNAGETDTMTEMIKRYILETEELRAKLLESEASYEALQRRSEMLAKSPSRGLLSPIRTHMSHSPFQMEIDDSVPVTVTQSSPEFREGIIEEAKKDLDKLKSKQQRAISAKQLTTVSNYTNEKDLDSNEESDQDIVETNSENNDENDNIIDGNVDSSEESDENDSDSASVQEDLAELTSEINIKQKLIEELEFSQRKVELLRMQYEEKLMLLQHKIKETEVERDRVLTSLSSMEVNREDKAKKIREDYQEKLMSMQNEVKKLQSAKKEHDKLRQQQSRQEKQLKTLQTEVADMKRTKVKLMNKIKEDAKKNKEKDAERTREISKLRKEERQRQNLIKTLAAKNKLSEAVIKRKQEELKALRKSKLTDKAAGRVPRSRQLATSKAANTVFNAKAAHQRWTSIEKRISSCALKKQTLFNLEKNMERYLEQREKLGRIVEKLERKKLTTSSADEATLKDLEDQIEVAKANFDYVQDQLSEVQEEIVQMEDSKDPNTGASGTTLDIPGLLENVRLDEAKYLLEHLLDLAVTKSLVSQQNEADIKELEAKMKQMEQNHLMQHQLLQLAAQQIGETDVFNFIVGTELEHNDGANSDSSSGTSSPVESKVELNIPPHLMNLTGNQGLFPKKDKVRRKTATPDELLYAESSDKTHVGKPISPVEEKEEELGSIPRQALSGLDNVNASNNQIRTAVKSAPTMKETIGLTRQKSFTCLRGSTDLPSDSSLMPPPRAPLQKNNSATNLRFPEPSPILKRRLVNQATEQSSSLRRKNSFTKNPVATDNNNTRGLTRQNSFTMKNKKNSYSNLENTGSTDDASPPDSPPIRDKNVFSRLYANTTALPTSPQYTGVINPYTGKTSLTKSAPLYCTHVAEGHDKPVLSLTATEDMLFSGSKDRTVKVWSLDTGKEIQVLGGHPNNVVAVRYSEEARVAFTVSMNTIKVWDLRENSSTCIKTLSSVGLTTNGEIPVEPNSRKVTLPPGEAQINDIQLSSSGTTLFSAATNTVRVWDLRQFSAIGKLSGGHQAAVMVLAVSPLDAETNFVVTGSKDHYIKTFELPEVAVGVHTPKYNLDPPHYDGIQSLAIMDSTLFSGSRDMCIKKWDLSEEKLKYSINQAHKDWVEALEILPMHNCLLSGGRDGYLKVWGCDKCVLIGEIRAHSNPINAISTNSSAIFTASNDHTIGIWKARNNLGSLAMHLADTDDRIT